MFHLAFYHISLLSLLSAKYLTTFNDVSTAEIFEAMWPLKNILSDIVIDLPYITHKCTTVYVYQMVIS